VFLSYARRLLVAAALVALGACRGAPATPPLQAAAASAAEPVKAAAAPLLLWRVQHAGAVMHLFGSVHVARAETYPLDPRIEAAFSASDVLVLELDLDDAARARAAQRTQELALYGPGQALSTQVSPETWALFSRTVESAATRAVLSRFRPWFVALALTAAELERLGFDAELGVDEHFRRRSAGVKRIVALETVESQLVLFNDLDAHKQDELLRQTLEELPSYAQVMGEAFGAWSRGDQGALDQLLLAPLRERDRELFDKLFSTRNRNMAERLAELLETPQSYFVVVGAGHLVGQGSVVHLLAERGMVPSLL
jgi:uncharacterized protein